MKADALRACLLASTLFLSPAMGLAADISLENVAMPTGPAAKLTFKHVDIADSSLTAEEAAKLFSGAVTSDEAAVLLGKLKAARISIPEAVLTSDKPGALVMHDIAAEGVDHGAAKRLAIGSVDFSVPMEGGGGDITFKSRRLTLDDVLISNLEAAIKAGKIGDGSVKMAHLAWEGFDLTTPDKDTPADAAGGNLISIKLASARIDQTYDGDAPIKSSGALNGLTIELPKASQSATALTAFGFNRIESGLQWSQTYDPAKQVLALDDLTLNALNIGSIGLRGEFGGVDKAALAGDKDAKMAAMMGADIRSLDLRVTNAGAFEKAVAFFSVTQGKAPDALKAEWSAIAAQGPAMLPGAPAAAQVSAALVKFIGNPKSVTFSLKPKAAPLKIADLQAIKDPMEWLAKVDVTAVAEVPAGAPVIAAAPAQVVSTPSAAPTTTDGPHKLTGSAAWSAVVGNTVTGKDTDGAPLSEYYTANGKVKQLDDDETAEGNWSVKGENVCFQFSGEEAATCYKVEVFGDVATFIDEDGDGKRYAILKGNPKGL